MSGMHRWLMLGILSILAAAPAGACAQGFPGWHYHAPIRFAGYTAPGAATNLPVLVRFAPDAIAGFSYGQFDTPAGSDLRFAAADGVTPLPYEVERWDPGGTSLVWVLAPEIAGTDTVVHAYWGGTGAGTPACATNGAAWSNGFVGVWHMGEDPAGTAPQVRDSTGWRSHGRSSGTMTASQRVSGIAGDALLFDGTNDYINCSNAPALAPANVTVSAWVRPIGAGSNADGNWIITKGRTAALPFLSYGLRHSPTPGNRLDTGFGITNGFALLSSATTNTSTLGFVHLAATYDRTAIRLYLNGRLENSLSQAGALSYALADTELHIGHWGTAGFPRQFQGIIDEVQVSGEARASNWIWAAWLNVASNASFQVVGPVALQTSNLTVRALSPSAVGATTAAVSGRLISAGGAESPSVLFCIDTSDQGTNDPAAWATRLAVTPSPAAGDTFAAVAAPLAAGQGYVYRTYATNSTGAAWSPELIAFRTIGPAGVTNTGATNVTATTAILRGAVVRIVEQAPTVEVRYWADGASATSSVALGVQTGAFQAAVAGLWPTTAYAYAISASNAAGAVWSEPAAFMTRGPFHVATNGSNAYPFDTWVTAATTISNALAAATNAGDAVLVAPGTYPITAGLSLTTAVSVIGVGPSTNAIIVCRLPAYGSVSPVVIDHPGALLDGFAITGCVNQLNYGVFGPLYLKRGLVQRCIVARNSNYSNGGGCISGGVLRDSVVQGNSAVHQNTGLGGGLRVTGGAVSNCLITGNYAVDGGGGLYVGAGNVDACTIVSNTTARASIVGGGGVDLEGGRLINCLIARNSLNNVMLSAYQGGGVRMTGGSLVHCTITANACSSLDRGSGVYMTGGGVTNCIVYGNGSRYPATAEENISATGGAIAYTCAQPRPAGTGNIDLPPELAAGSALDGGLAFGSPCVDAALPLSWVTADQAGAPRPADGDGDGAAAPDMGCRERIAAGATFECLFSAAATEGTNSLDALFSAVTTGPGTGTVTYCWDWESDGLVDAAGPELAAATHLYASPGVYTVTLVCTNAFGDTASATRSRYIFVWSPDAYVATNGAHIAPYETWAKAATNVQAAVDAVLGTGTVHVAAGTYTVGTKIAVARGTRLVSEDGYAATTLRSPGPSRILDLFHPAALVDGFTLTGIALGYPHSGAIYMTGGEVRNCRVTGNTLGTQGGAIHMEGGFVHDCILTNNTASHQNTGFGGGVWMNAGVVSNCLIENNRCVDGGGGVYSSGGTIRDSRIVSNSSAYAPANGGGLWLAGGRAENCLVIRNRLTAASPTGYGGGIYMTGGSLIHCTVADNQRTLDSYSGIYMTGGGVTNTIAFYNSTAFPAAGSENVFRSGGTIGYSCAQPAPAGSANVGDDPSFAGRPAGDYHLAFGSPCADTGTNLPAIAADLDGAPRPQDGNGDSVAVSDMGAYERPTTTATFTCAFSATPSVGTNSVAAVFTATVSGPGTSSVFYAWDWTSDGEIDDAGADRGVAAHTYAEPGFYSVTLSCTNALGQSASQTRVAYILVYSTDAYVSTNGLNRPPYHTWETAARNVADAVTVVADYGTIHVSNGTYSLSAAVTITRPITVVSTDGPTSTVLRTTGPQHFFLSHPSAVVDGFLLTGGNLGFGNYGAANLNGGTLRRCIVTGNSIGSCGGVFVASGTVERCVITNNTANHQNTGYGGGLRMTGGLACDTIISGNVANDGGGGVYMSGGLVSNCTIHANRRSGGNAGRFGGGVWMTGGLLMNCDIRSNVVVNATDAGGGGIYMAGGTNRTCLITANTVTNNGAGVYMDGGQIQNATIVGNTTLNPTGAVAGLYLAGGGATNCIIYYNMAPGGLGGDIGGLTTNIGYSCAPSLVGGARGNISADPHLAGTNAANYRPVSGSPCVDRGRNLEWMPAGRDLDGNPRVIRSVVDMGAYELAPFVRTVVIIR